MAFSMTKNNGDKLEIDRDITSGFYSFYSFFK